jgi:hypothetical protein
MADVTQYVELITSEHNQRPNFVALISTICQASVDQQNLLLSFPQLFDVDTAAGDQLDKIGEWAGVSRNLKQEVMGISVLPDDSYRVLVKLFIAQNQWKGTVPDMYVIWNTLFGAQGFQILVQDYQDMSMAIVFINPPADVLTLAILTQGYFLMRPAGVFIIGFFKPSLPDGPVFGFDAENATVSGFDVGDFVVPV